MTLFNVSSFLQRLIKPLWIRETMRGGVGTAFGTTSATAQRMLRTHSLEVTEWEWEHSVGLCVFPFWACVWWVEWWSQPGCGFAVCTSPLERRREYSLHTREGCGYDNWMWNLNWAQTWGKVKSDRLSGLTGVTEVGVPEVRNWQEVVVAGEQYGGISVENWCVTLELRWRTRTEKPEYWRIICVDTEFT